MGEEAGEGKGIKSKQQARGRTEPGPLQEQAAPAPWL